MIQEKNVQKTLNPKQSNNVDQKIQKIDIEEKKVKLPSGFIAILFCIIFLSSLIFSFVEIIISLNHKAISVPTILTYLVLLVFSIIGMVCFARFIIVKPNDAYVYTMFGKYKGTINEPGFYWIYPLWIKHAKVSLKMSTLNNDVQKVNDELGNPIEIGVVIIWKIINTARACFVVENYNNFISTQADSSVRHVARLHPYDTEKGGEKSLRGSTVEIASLLRNDLQERVKFAGIDIIEVHIAHLAYAPEIASAMLQRQQATAIIEARQKIVDGAVGMVESALVQISEKKICEFDNKTKASTVSNLLVVLCSSKDATPVVNIGESTKSN